MSSRVLDLSDRALEDEELVERFHQGDPDALNALFERYRRLARSKARSYFLVGADDDDIEQEGMIGLYKAARDYQSDRQTSFRAFAELCVTRQVISAVKAATRRKHQPLNESVSMSALNRGESIERSLNQLRDARAGTDPADAIVSMECMAGMRKSVADTFSVLEVDVLRLYVEGKTYQEIGARLGRPEKSIDNALQRIKRKLDQHLTSARDVDEMPLAAAAS